jgi:hypothetical protein
VLATTDSNHDFEPVTVGQALGGVAAAWHDFTVALNRDALADQLQLRQQLGAVERAVELPTLAVDRDRYHSGIVTRLHRLWQYRLFRARTE